jgi:hypothetical protein
LTLGILHTTGAPDYCWLLVLQYVRDIMNLTAVQSLDWKTPLESLTGQVPDTSIALLFQFYDEVYYKAEPASFPHDTVEKKGYFVGFAHDVGHAMTFKVLDAVSLKILHRSIIRRASDQRNLSVDPEDSRPFPPLRRRSCPFSSFCFAFLAPRSGFA